MLCTELISRTSASCYMPWNMVRLALNCAKKPMAANEDIDEDWSSFQYRVQYSNTKEIRASVSGHAILQAQQGAPQDRPLASAALSQIPLLPSPAPAETFREQDMPRPAQPEQPVTASLLMKLLSEALSEASTKTSIEIAKTSTEEIRDKLDKLDAVMRGMTWLGLSYLQLTFSRQNLDF